MGVPTRDCISTFGLAMMPYRLDRQVGHLQTRLVRVLISSRVCMPEHPTRPLPKDAVTLPLAIRLTLYCRPQWSLQYRRASSTKIGSS